jgi:hypothetical protein
MDYRGGLKTMYVNPNWLMQTTLIGLCWLIPVVGPIATLGYSFEAAAYLHKRNGEHFPDFDFGRFGPYLARGIGPVLAMLAFSVVLIPVVVVEYVVTLVVPFLVALLADLVDPNSGSVKGILAVCVFLLLALVFTIVNCIVMIYMWGLTIRGGLTGEISEAFKVGWCPEFAKRAGSETFFAQLYLSFLTVLLINFAIAPWLLFLASLPAIGIFYLSYSWLCFQLYRTYLSEKGPPFKVKCDILDQ